ncbi:MAG: hypothetical protein AUJ72_04115 [Candidatus Omnitrophica bacterium CG1_02_46_14]|nr:MAG: hypothetical protein AUJ72_04115 [Candidatus Omnitrophica bacterium CG1_02_46_14]
MADSPVLYPRERVRHKDFYIDVNFRVIYEDEDILVLHKPAPLAVHPVGSYSELNIHSLLKKDPRWANMKIRFAHRLDAETSGVLLIAKHYEAARFLGKEFIAGRVKKKYHAVVFGCPEALSGVIDLPLGHDGSSGFQTVRIVDRENGETAKTHYRILHSNGEYSVVELQPRTGRTHQLRAHMSFIGYPIVGDKIYIDLKIFSRYVVHGLDEEMLAQLKMKRLALHASELSFTHPRTHEWVTFNSDMPEDIRLFIATIGEQCEAKR